MRHCLGELSRRVEQTRGVITELEERSIAFTQPKQQREDRLGGKWGQPQGLHGFWQCPKSISLGPQRAARVSLNQGWKKSQLEIPSVWWKTQTYTYRKTENKSTQGFPGGPEANPLPVQRRIQLPVQETQVQALAQEDPLRPQSS